MKKAIYFLLILLSVSFESQAQQTTAMDFNRLDCNGVQHHLFSTLDSNDVVILEFFMLNCFSCINAGNKMKPMFQSLQASYPDHVSMYDIGFDDTYTCTDIADWVTTNNFDAYPMDSGGAMLAYYGGFGMPTIVVLGGVNHEVLFTGIGFSTSDTALIGSSIRNFFLTNPLGVNDVKKDFATNVFPNPSNALVDVSLVLEKSSDVTIQIVDLTGRVMNEINYGKVEAGQFIKQLNTSVLPTGLFLLRTHVDGQWSQIKINVAK